MFQTTVFQGLYNASYKVNNVIRHYHPVPLNHNHTHLLLVDDGYRNRYGGVAEFRASLERKIAQPVKPIEEGQGNIHIRVGKQTFICI